MYTALSNKNQSSGYIAVKKVEAKVRFVHDVASDIRVDIYVDGRLLIGGAQFQYYSELFPLSGGSHKIEVRVQGTNNVLISGNITFEAGHNYTIIIYGTQQKVMILPIRDDSSCPMTGQARVRFIHAAAGVPMVDIYTGGNTKLFGGVSYGQSSQPMYSTIPSGTYSIQAAPTGTRSFILNVPINLKSGGVYTMIASGNGTSNYPISVIVISDSSSCTIYS